MKPAILYVSYDGMLEPLGQSQVLAYLEQLAGHYDIHLISYEKAQDWPGRRSSAAADRIRAAGIRWYPLRYHKTPTAPATAWDICIGAATAIMLALRYRIRLVHARSYVAALIGLAVKKACGAPLLFDMRGFWADERVDGGLWLRESQLFAAAKAAERRLLLGADHVVTLTHAAAREIGRFPYLADRPPPISVIPTCADFYRFRPPEQVPSHPFTLGYLGSVGTWYMFDEVLTFYKLLQEQIGEARLLIVNRDEHELITEKLRAAGIAHDQYQLRTATHEQVPALIGRMTVGAALIKPAYSKLASAPTKLAEYLGCGIPCLGNAGVGDMTALIEDNQVGISLPGFSEAEQRQGVDRLLRLLEDRQLASRCVAVAKRHFSLEDGVAELASIYTRLLSHG